MFVYISDLPPQVKNVLDVGLQQVWLNAYNASFSLSNDETQAYQYAWGKVLQSSFPGQIDLPTPQVATSPQPVGMGEVQNFAIDMQTVKLDEDGTSWIQAFPVGTWHHPKHGKIEMTPERAARFADNVNNNVRGQELDIDYDHKERTNEASGWVKMAQARADGLWLKVQWTADAAKKIRDKAYRYFSPEYLDEWEEPRTKSRVKDVLLGGALTNRPFLKGILPVNLSEVLSNTKAHNDGGKMDWNEIRAMLGLPDGTPEDQVRAEFSKRLNATGSETDAAKAEAEKAAAEAKAAEDAKAAADKAAADAEAAKNEKELVTVGQLSEHIRKLSETDPVVRALAEQVDKLNMANKLSEISVKLNSLDNEKYALAPASVTKLRELMVEAPTALSDKIFDLFKETVAAGVVELGERGSQTHTDNSSATKRFSDLIDAKVKADTTLSYGEATDIVASEHPALFTEYRNESYLKEGAK